MRSESRVTVILLGARECAPRTFRIERIWVILILVYTMLGLGSEAVADAAGGNAEEYSGALVFLFRWVFSIFIPVGLAFYVVKDT
jgi:hypothetical protein